MVQVTGGTGGKEIFFLKKCPSKIMDPRNIREVRGLLVKGGAISPRNTGRQRGAARRGSGLSGCRAGCRGRKELGDGSLTFFSAHFPV